MGSRVVAAALLVIAVSLGACASAPRPAEATLRVVRPADERAADSSSPSATSPTQVFIDDRAVGRRDGPPVGLRAGVHRVEVRAEGRFAAFREVTLVRGEHRELAVPLRPDLDHPTEPSAP